MRIGRVPEHWRRLLGALLGMTREERTRLLREMAPPALRALVEEWRLKAHPGQIEPEGDWRIWLLMAGRGFGGCERGFERARPAPTTIWP